MNIEEVRDFALSLHPKITEILFAGEHLSFRICGKWFLLTDLEDTETRIAVKLPPEEAEDLRDKYEGIQPAYHMNKKHWSDLYTERLPRPLVEQCIRTSFELVKSKLTKKERALLEEESNF